MNSLAERANAFTMDNPHTQYAFYPAGGKVFGNKVFYIGWTKGMQVQHPINGLLHFIHQPSNLRPITEALWPPKPKELLTNASTRISRALFGT